MSVERDSRALFVILELLPMRTIPLYLVALIVAIANTPLDIFQINAWNVGTLKVEPWRRKPMAAVTIRARAVLTRIRTWFHASGGLPAVAMAVGLLVLLIALPHVHGHVGAFPAMAAVGLNDYRQRAADLKGEIAKLSKQRADLGNAAVAEKRSLTDDERAKFVALGPQIETLKSQLEENGQLLAAAEEANEAERTFAAGRVKPDADATVADAGAAGAGLRGTNLTVGESAEEKAMKAPGFFGKCLHAVRHIAVGEGTAEDQKLVKMMAGPTGASTDVPSDGGFLVAPERSSTIIQRAYDTGAIASLVTRLPIGPGSNGIVLPAIDETSRADGSRFGGIASSWVGQGVTATAGKPKFRAMELKLRKLLAFVYGTDELLVDAIAFDAWVNQNLPKELQFRVEDAIVNGDGSNKPQGFLSSGAAVTVTRNTVARVLYEDVSGMWKRMWAPLRSTAVWIIDQSVEQDLEQISIAIGTAGVLAPIYKPAGVAIGPNGTQGYSPATLYGRPVLTTEYNAALGTVGDIVLTNLGEYTLIDKGGVNQAVSMHVAFLTDEAVYRFTYRVDGQLNWNAALTPKSGGSTLSPVVTLT